MFTWRKRRWLPTGRNSQKVPTWLWCRFSFRMDCTVTKTFRSCSGSTALRDVISTIRISCAGARFITRARSEPTPRFADVIVEQAEAFARLLAQEMLRRRRMKDPATIKMLQELGAFILAGAKGPRDVKTMAEMIRAARGYCWVGVYKTESRRSGDRRGNGRRAAVLSENFRRRRDFAARRSIRTKTIVVDDVSKDVRYLPAFHSTRSEIVVPMISQSERVVGAIVGRQRKAESVHEGRSRSARAGRSDDGPRV